jgi:simple sugar transport system ATP-binding protein
MLEIARSLRRGARFIILDEPTARLAAREIEPLFDHIKQA